MPKYLRCEGRYNEFELPISKAVLTLLLYLIFLQDLKEDTTHLVAIKPGTAKVNAARRTWQVKIVNPDWLWTCAERWECVDERLYPLTKRVSHFQRA